MADIFNEQRVLGVVLLADGDVIYNDQPVFGIVDAADTLFSDDLRTMGVDVLDADTVGMHNDQPVRGVVLIADGRTLYNYQRVVPAKAVTGALA